MENVISKLETFNIETQERKVIYEENAHFEAPNWSRDGQYFIFNSGGKLYKLGVDGKNKTLIPTGFADQCNNDHGISPNGKKLVISHNDIDGVSKEEQRYGTSRIYILPIKGGKPKVVTTKVPSYWHGWSPDGKTLAYVARRNDDYDIYTISVKGGKETRLTSTKGLDDGPDYSPNGKYIYYNSYQTGRMEIWRMDADGKKPIQLTNDSFANWFPHPSPDGKYLVYLAYVQDQKEAHPAMKKVVLRLYDLETEEIRTLCSFIGGQGTINVPSWSPDGKQFAFVSYEEQN